MSPAPVESRGRAPLRPFFFHRGKTYPAARTHLRSPRVTAAPPPRPRRNQRDSPLRAAPSSPMPAAASAPAAGERQQADPHLECGSGVELARADRTFTARRTGPGCRGHPAPAPCGGVGGARRTASCAAAPATPSSAAPPTAATSPSAGMLIS